MPEGVQVPVLSDLVSLQYVRPDLAGTLLVGDSDHSDPEWVDPDSYSEVTDDNQLVRSIGKFEHRFPGLTEARLRSTYAGCYDVTPDYNPVIAEAPLAGLFVLAGFSGHGYKISPAVGWPPIWSCTGRAGVRTSTTTTSAWSGSPRAIC